MFSFHITLLWPRAAIPEPAKAGVKPEGCIRRDHDLTGPSPVGEGWPKAGVR